MIAMTFALPRTSFIMRGGRCLMWAGPHVQSSNTLGPFTGFFERFPSFQQALQARQNMWPAMRHSLNELRTGLFDTMDHGEFDRCAERFEFVGQPRIAFLSQFRLEFVSP